jgi:hypothetical protein
MLHAARIKKRLDWVEVRGGRICGLVPRPLCRRRTLR